VALIIQQHFKPLQSVSHYILVIIYTVKLLKDIISLLRFKDVIAAILYLSADPLGVPKLSTMGKGQYLKTKPSKKLVSKGYVKISPSFGVIIM